jgi:hypothetical protein
MDKAQPRSVLTRLTLITCLTRCTGMHVIMSSGIDPMSGEPVYRQLAAIIRSKIESGKYPPGAPLPSAKSMAHPARTSNLLIDPGPLQHPQRTFLAGVAAQAFADRDEPGDRI